MAGVARLGLAPDVRGGEVERVEHREQPHAETLGGVLQELGLLAQRALAEVVEVGLQAAERVEVLVALRGDEGLGALSSELGLELLVQLAGIGPPVEQGVQGQVRARSSARVPSRLAGAPRLASSEPASSDRSARGSRSRRARIVDDLGVDDLVVGRAARARRRAADRRRRAAAALLLGGLLVEALAEGLRGGAERLGVAADPLDVGAGDATRAGS